MLLAQRKLMALFAKDVKITATAWWGFPSFAIMDQYWTNRTTSNRSIEVRESGADFVRSPLYLVNYITVVSWRRSLCWWWWRWWCFIPILFPLTIRNWLVHVNYAPRNESVGLILSYFPPAVCNLIFMKGSWKGLSDLICNNLKCEIEYALVTSYFKIVEQGWESRFNLFFH